MSSSTRPIRTSAALALSLGLHALLVGVGFLSGPGSPTQPKSAEARSIQAQKKLVQLTEIANQLEALKKQPSQETPPPASIAQAHQVIEKALSDSVAARNALEALEQSVGKPEQASKAFAELKERTEQAQKSQAEAFQLLDQQLQAAAQKPEAVALRAALAKQLAAQLATKRAEEQQKRLPPQTDKAGLEKALAEAKAAHDEAIKALGEAKQEQERVQKYERLADKEKPDGSGSTENKILPPLAEEKATDAAVRQQNALEAQKNAVAELEKAERAEKLGDKAKADAAKSAAKAAREQAKAAQAEAERAIAAAQEALQKEGATITGQDAAQKNGLDSAAAAQKRASEAQRAAANGDLAAQKKALAAQQVALAQQSQLAKAMRGSSGEKPDPNHKHGPECFAPGGT
ncbi:hypothetical protein [Armatimonas sp.]|uniref:hypothetical protein n=1 Tax=Armatimonas sp. TaxID=1872638 RepID=UPI00286D28A4|nr:hypothetical protein [Armatimonas sp.]